MPRSSCAPWRPCTALCHRQSAAERRALWSRAGVADDELSATVVVGGLRLVSDGLLARVARLCTEAGQAASPSPTSGSRVSSPCPPPLPHSLSTWWRTPASSPFAASAPTVRRLSARLAGPTLPRSSSCAYSSTGCRDFDGEDIRIAAYVLDKTRAHPWRMTAADYRAAVVRNAHGLLPGASPERRGTPRWPPRPWLSTAPPWSRNRWPMCCWKTSLPSPRAMAAGLVQLPSSA
nr:TIGR02679 domain-containing protein [Streptomyces sp. JV185]